VIGFALTLLYVLCGTHKKKGRFYTMAKYTFEQIMDMKEPAFVAMVAKEKKQAEYNEICGRTTTQKKYPKVQKPMKKTAKNVKDGTYDANKLTWQADKTKKPTIVHKPITFFEVKTAFAKEVLKLEPKGKVAKETFRDRAAAAAQNA